MLSASSAEYVCDLPELDPELAKSHTSMADKVLNLWVYVNPVLNLMFKLH